MHSEIPSPCAYRRLQIFLKCSTLRVLLLLFVMFVLRVSLLNWCNAGPIPCTFGNLSRLNYLDIRSNQLTGECLTGRMTHPPGPHCLFASKLKVLALLGCCKVYVFRVCGAGRGRRHQQGHTIVKISMLYNILHQLSMCQLGGNAWYSTAE